MSSEIIIRPEYSRDQKIRITSDIHLGHKKASTHEVDELKDMITDCDVFVCAGDIAELRLGRFQEAGINAYAELQELIKTIDNDFIGIGGNHDPKVLPRAAYLRDDEIFVMHGDAVFRSGAPWGREYLQNKPIIGDLLAQYNLDKMTLEERLILSAKIADLIPAILSPEYTNNNIINFLLHAGWPPSRPFRIVGAWILQKYLIRRFVRFFKIPSKIIITGHFHRPTLFRGEGKIYINTGAHFKYSKAWIVDVIGDSLSILETISPQITPKLIYSIDLKDPNLKITKHH